MRAGHTEAAVDLARLAGFSGAGVICEIMKDDGTMARLPDLVEFAEKHHLRVGSIADLIAYRRRMESLVEKIYDSVISSAYGGDFKFCIYKNTIQYAEHVALVKGDVKGSNDPVLVRMHAVDFLCDILGVHENAALQKSMELIEEEGRGVIVILRDFAPDALSRRVIRSSNQGDLDTEGKREALRDYGIGAQILLDIGVRSMILLSDNPKTVVGLDGYGLHIAGQRPVTKE